MLVLTRRLDQSIHIRGDIIIDILGLTWRTVKFGIVAPEDVVVEGAGDGRYAMVRKRPEPTAAGQPPTWTRSRAAALLDLPPGSRAAAHLDLQSDHPMPGPAQAVNSKQETTRMLILSRRKDQSIIIREDIVLTVLGISNGNVKIGIEAPKDVAVDRSEIHERKAQGLTTSQDRVKGNYLMMPKPPR